MFEFMIVQQQRIFSYFFLHGFDDTVFCKKKGFVLRIADRVDIYVLIYPFGDREHIVEVDDSIVFDFQKIQPLFHSFVFFLERRQRGKIVCLMDMKNNTDVFSFVLLTGLLIQKQMRCKGTHIFNIPVLNLI